MTGAYKNISRGGGFCFQALLVFTVPARIYIHMELTNKLIKRKNLCWYMYCRQIIPTETLQASSSLCDRVSHSSWWLEPPTGNWKIIGSISEQFVMYTAVFPLRRMVYFSNIVWIISPLFIAILFTCYVFSCGLPIKSFWFSAVSREINRKRKITLSYVICKEKDLDKRCPEIRTAPTRRTIIAMKETSWLTRCVYLRSHFLSLRLKCA